MDDDGWTSKNTAVFPAGASVPGPSCVTRRPLLPTFQTCVPCLLYTDSSLVLFLGSAETWPKDEDTMWERPSVICEQKSESSSVISAMNWNLVSHSIWEHLCYWNGQPPFSFHHWSSMKNKQERKRTFNPYQSKWREIKRKPQVTL